MTLLRAGQYSSAAALLEETEVLARGEVDEAVATILEATRQMCQAGSDYQEEVAFHKEAYHSASKREQQLREQLVTVLRLIMAPQSIADGEEPAALASRQRREIPGLLRRVQDLLGLSLASGAQAVGRAMEASNEELAPQAAKQGDAPEAPARSGAPPGLPPEPAGDEAPRRRGTAKAEPSLAVYCLGHFRVYDNGRPLDDWTGNKSKSIFKYLILNREQPVHRDVLMELFWGNDDPEAARHNLYQTIYMLRQALQTHAPDFQHILCENSCYLFNPQLALSIDFEAFLRHYEAGRRSERLGKVAAAVRAFEAAEEYYEGDLLVEDLYEEWTLMMRERLKNAYLTTLDRLSLTYWSQRQFSLCIAYCQKILQADRCREDVHRRLMMAYVQQGHHHLALRQYHRCVEAFRQELDATPMPATVALYEKIRNHQL